MERSHTVNLRHLVFRYCLELVLLSLLVSLLLFRPLQPVQLPKLPGTYVSADGAVPTLWGLQIPWEEIEQRTLSQEALQALYIPYLRGVLLRAVLSSALLFLLLSLAFAALLTRRLLSPIEKTAAHLQHPDSRQIPKDLPWELSQIAEAFQQLQEKYNRLSADFENLSAYISHEQKNALALLRSTLQNEAPNLSLRVGGQIQRMVLDLDDILTLTANTPHVEAVDLTLLCGQAADEYHRVYPSLSFDFMEDADCTVRGNELLLYRAVSNLIDNAIKYGEGKPVSVYVGIQRDCPYVSVSDQGMGIRMEQQEKIFESQYRIGSRKKDGYGIGLSLVRHVAQIHSGFVWVESQEHCGSTLKLILPPFTKSAVKPLPSGMGI